MTLMMIAKARGNDDLIISLDGRLRDFMAKVPKRVWIYSPLKKRNISRDAFLKEVKSVKEQGVPRIVG